MSPDLPPWKDKLNHTVSPKAQQQASHAKPTTFTSTVVGRGAPHLFVFIRSRLSHTESVGSTITRTHELARHMPGPRPKHNEAATDEAETLGGCFESSIMRTGVVVALKIARIKKVRGSGLPCETTHSFPEFPLGEPLKDTQCPSENREESQPSHTPNSDTNTNARLCFVSGVVILCVILPR